MSGKNITENFTVPALIKMKSIQITDGDESEVELITKGTYSYEDGRYRVSYEDSEATGFEDSVTTVEVEGEKFASVIREGSSSSNLILEVNRKHHCHYGTPYGDMMVGIFSQEINNKLSPDGGKLRMSYTIDINASYISDNVIVMEIERV